MRPRFDGEETGRPRPSGIVLGAFGLVFLVLIAGGGYLVWRNLPSRYWPA